LHIISYDYFNKFIRTTKITNFSQIIIIFIKNFIIFALLTVLPIIFYKVYSQNQILYLTNCIILWGGISHSFHKNLEKEKAQSPKEPYIVECNPDDNLRFFVVLKAAPKQYCDGRWTAQNCASTPSVSQEQTYAI